MPVVKQIVSNNKLHTLDLEMLIDYIMSVQSELKLEFVKKLQTLDLEPVAVLLMHPTKGVGWTKERTVQAIAHYKMFLFLHYLYPHHKIISTMDIDVVWEHHFLDIAKYRQDCKMLFGYFLEHNPYFGLLDQANEKNSSTTFAENQLVFEQHFGTDFLAAVNLQLTKNAHFEPVKQQNRSVPEWLMSKQV